MDTIVKEPGLPVGIPPDEIDLTVKNVCGRVDYTKQEMAGRRLSWQKISDAYAAEETLEFPFGVKNVEARIHTPTMAAQIDRLVQMLTIRMMVPYENFIEAAIRVNKLRSYKVENFLFDMYKRNEMATEAIKAVQSAGLFGIGFTKVIPNYNAPFPDCYLQHIPNKDLYIDPFATKISNAAYIIEEMRIDYNTLMRNYMRGVYNIHSEFQRLMEDCRMRETETTPQLTVASLLSPEVISRDDYTPLPGELRRVFPGLHYISSNSSFDTTDDEEFDRFLVHEYHDREYILTVVNKKYLIRARRVSMRYPYQAWYLRLDPNGRMYPKSHGELIAPIQMELDVKRNQRVENINKLNDPPVLYTTTAIRKLEDFIIRSGKKIEVNNLDGIKFVDIKDSTGMLFEEGQSLKQEIAEMTGVQGFVVGAPSKSERMTRQEAAGLQAQATMPFDFSSALMTITGMIPMFQTILMFCSVMGEIPAFAADTPSGIGDPVEILPEEFLMDYDISISINPNKVAKDKQEALEIFSVLSQSPYVDQVLLLKWIIPRLAPEAPRELVREQPTGQIPPGTPPPMAG